MSKSTQRHNRPFLLIAAAALLCASCATTERAYISDAQRDSAQAIVNSYVGSIHPGDQLYIYVASESPEATIPFNEETNKIVPSRAQLSANGVASGTEQSRLAAAKAGLAVQDHVGNLMTGYLVSQGGDILFPVLGKIHAAGITRDSLASLIEHRLIDEGYINDPTVTVQTLNFRVSVMGEVAKPQELHLTGDRLTIFEALALCGDITIHGKRENVTVLREQQGVATPVTLNLTDRSILDSPYYYLQSNDIVYVEPDDLKKKLAVRDSDIPHYISIGVSTLHLITTTMRTYIVLLRGH